MRPIEFVMNSKNLRKPEKGVEWNPTLPALELGSETGFTKGTIIPQKPPSDDNLERWRDAAYSFRHTPRVTPLRRTGQLLDGRQPGSYCRTRFAEAASKTCRQVSSVLALTTARTAVESSTSRLTCCYN